MITVFILFILLIITWRIDRTFFHPYFPNLKDEIFSQVTTTKISVPKDKESCLAKGGVWKKLGPRPIEECNLPTKDAGKICSNGSECESICQAEISREQLQKGMRGQMFKTKGKCSSWVKILGCRGYVNHGWATVICAD